MSVKFNTAIRSNGIANIDHLLDPVEELIDYCQQFKNEAKIGSNNRAYIKFFIILNIYKFKHLSISFTKSINNFDFLLAAQAARCLFENAICCNFHLKKMETTYDKNGHIIKLKEFETSAKECLSSIFVTRDRELLEPEMWDDGGPTNEIPLPKSLNILTMLEKVNDNELEKLEFGYVYGKLSDMCHPNIGLNGFFNPPGEEGKADDGCLVIRDKISTNYLVIFFQMISGSTPNSYVFTFAKNLIFRLEKMASAFSLGPELRRT